MPIIFKSRINQRPWLYKFSVSLISTQIKDKIKGNFILRMELYLWKVVTREDTYY
jgi:hypothetical protein